ncbi:MAG: Uncharacterized protein FD131_4968 [Rhodocyclaceae bacterium]|nr:MAG: Uncharacterized protein FD131_4968 [Rhodocyclaceae bacterium]
MIQISIRTNFADVIKRLDALPEKIANKAMVKALNTTIGQAKTNMASQIGKEFNLKVGAVKDRLTVTPASRKSGELKLQAKLEATKRGNRRSMNLIAFQDGLLTTKTAKTAGRRNSVGQLGFKIKKSGGRKVITGSFIGNQGRTVFVRTGKDRLPIKAVNTIDVPQMFNTRRINQAVQRIMQERFATNFDRALRDVLREWAK